MKVIFLDIDGVLVKQHTFADKRKSNECSPDCIESLNNLIRDTGAKLVISSGRRKIRTKEEILEEMQDAGYAFDIYDYTPNLASYKGVEIDQWLRDHRYDEDPPTGYVIIDDESDMMLWQAEHFIQTDRWAGLTPTTAYKAERVLKNREIQEWK